MKIVAVSTMLREADICIQSVTHLLGEGVDHCIVSVGEPDDGTAESLGFIRDVTVLSQTGPLDQGAEMTWLAEMAADMGADWIIPFDADEVWIDPLGGTIRSVLESLPPDCLKVHCAVFKHRDWDHRYTEQGPLGKTAFRPVANMIVHWGNHDVDLPKKGSEEHGLLEIRELQYRDQTHYNAKIQKAAELFDSWAVPPEHGHHMRQLVGMSEGERLGEWTRLCSQDVILNPIPYKGLKR